MKNIIKLSILSGILALVASLTVQAQTLDAFNQLRPLIVSQTYIPTNGVTASTNGPFDMIGYVNRGILLVSMKTNQGSGGSATLQLQTSTDTTNWAAVTNYAVVSANTSVTYTNLGVLSAGQIWSSTNFSVTDNYLVPFTTTTPYAPIAGFSPPYYAPSLFTNQAAAIGLPGNQWIELSVNWSDQQRYARVIYTYTGAITNAACYNDISALWLGPRIYAP